MHIYKFTHIESGKCYIGQTIQDPNQRRLEHINHARRRENGTEGGWVRQDGGAMKGKSHPNKGGTSANKGLKAGMTWKVVNGKRVWMNKENSNFILL